MQVLMRRDLWLQDEGLTVLLVALLLMIFVVNPLAAAGVFRGYAALVHDLWLALTLLSGVFAMGWRRKAAQVVVLAAVVLFALRALGFAGGVGGLVVDFVLTIFLLVTLGLMVVWQILREGPITRQRVQGSIVLYLLLGLIWAEAYTLAAHLDASAFAGTLPEEQNALSAHLTYFSFVTLTTVGYGDILPASLATRSLANFEGLLGTLFPAILIARLVSMEIAARQANDTNE
ncbi:MAG TPA: potassium channel family protein [Burkholderiaceae bacterium]|nr:potassium channel family protein [Burkholderiaceae bacterium]